MNADRYVSTGQGLLGYNMFAYCNNDPANNVDLSGELLEWFVLAAVVIVPMLFTSCSGTTPKQVNLESNSFDSYEEALEIATQSVYEKGISHSGEFDINGEYAQYGIEYNIDIYYCYSDEQFYITTAYTDNKEGSVVHRELANSPAYVMVGYTHYHPNVTDMSTQFSLGDENVADSLGCAMHLINANKVVNSNYSYMPDWKKDIINN